MIKPFFSIVIPVYNRAEFISYAIESCFEPGKELLTFNSFDELLDIIERAKKYPQEMKTIREAGCKRAHAEHTYEIRLNYILSKI